MYMEDIKYDKKTGKLFKNGKEIGTVVLTSGNKTNYRRVQLKDKVYFAHRLIWEMNFGKIPEGMLIDHIDGNGLNNRLENLRLCTPRENSFNRTGRKDTKSCYKGVHFHKKDNGEPRKFPWRAQIQKDKVIHVKCGFKTEREAAMYYNKKAVEFFGEFAKLNDV